MKSKYTNIGDVKGDMHTQVVPNTLVSLQIA